MTYHFNGRGGGGGDFYSMTDKLWHTHVQCECSCHWNDEVCMSTSVQFNIQLAYHCLLIHH